MNLSSRTISPFFLDTLARITLVLWALGAFPLWAQDAATMSNRLEVSPIISVGTTYLSRYNLRSYQGQSYRGLRYVEISGQIDQEAGDRYNSAFWQLSETTHDLRSAVAGVENSDRLQFSRDDLVYSTAPYGSSYPEHLNHFPEYRNFPVLPTALLESIDGPDIPEIGSSYEMPGYRLVDPDDDGQFTPVSIYVRYQYRGTGEYLGERVHFVDADFALRSDGRYTGFRVQGRNEVRITIFPGSNTRIFMNNSIAEQYQFAGGRSIRLEGFGLTWIRSPEPVYRDPAFLTAISAYNSDSPRQALADSSSPASSQISPTDDIASNPTPSSTSTPGSVAASRPGQAQSESASTRNEPSQSTADSNHSTSNLNALDNLPSVLPSRISTDSQDIEVSADALGLRLNLPNIQFVADSAELLPGEMGRIRVLADVLQEVPERRFLVIGHSADVGNPEGQMNLSVQRAKAVADLLAAQGIPPGTLRYEGRGALEPVGDNGTAEGRAQNRRVEVIILN